MFRLLHYEVINLVPKIFLAALTVKTSHRITVFFLLKTEPNFLSAIVIEAHKQSLGICDQDEIPPSPIASIFFFTEGI